jgi:hypothetical protein
LKAKRYGVKVKEFDLNLPTRDVDEVVSAFKKQITRRTTHIYTSLKDVEFVVEGVRDLTKKG